MPQQIQVYVFDIFTGAIAVAVFMQACILLGMFIALRKLQVKVEDVLDRAMPLIASSKVTLEDLGPKLKTISANLVEVSETLKQESLIIKASVDDVLEKTRAQTARVDEMVSGTLDGLSQASAAIQQGIEVPLRHITAIFNGLRAGFGVLRSKPTEERAEPTIKVEEPVAVVAVEEAVAAKPAV
jgi:hypothetical protein